jgi:hypothetical protein
MMHLARLTMVAAAIVGMFATGAVAQDDGWPEGSAMNVGGLENKRLASADALLARLDGRLVKLVAEARQASPAIPPDDLLIEALEVQEVAWRRYLPDECGLVGALTGAGGSWPSTYAVRCEANLVEMRVRRTRASIRCLEKLPPEKRRLDQGRCLYLLAPLAIPLRP